MSTGTSAASRVSRITKNLSSLLHKESRVSTPSLLLRCERAKTRQLLLSNILIAPPIRHKLQEIAVSFGQTQHEVYPFPLPCPHHRGRHAIVLRFKDASRSIAIVWFFIIVHGDDDENPSWTDPSWRMDSLLVDVFGQQCLESSSHLFVVASQSSTKSSTNRFGNGWSRLHWISYLFGIVVDQSIQGSSRR